MEKQIAAYLKRLNIPVSLRYVRKRIASHPDYPSLLSASDTLEQMGIPHGVARLEKEQLKTLSYPYMLHVEKGSGEFLIVKGEEDLDTKSEELQNWNGIVLKAEAPESVEDEGNREYLAKEEAVHFAFGLLILSVLAMSAVGWVPRFSWTIILFTATSIAGIVLGYLFVAKDLGVKYDAVESFCNAGKSTNCDRVLRSDEATLFGQFSFSDAVLSYFAAQLITAGLLIPLAGQTAPLWWALATAGVLTLPVVAYSLWLQGVKFKTWCRLCLLVVGVLVVQAGLFGWMAAAGVLGLADGTPWATGLVAGLFLASSSLVFLLKTRLKDGSEAEQAEVAASRIKYNPSVFAHLLLQQPQVDCTPFEQELLIGQSQAPLQLMMAASLGCAPCKEGFEKAAQLVEQWPEHVNLTVRFLIQKKENGAEDNHLGETLLKGWLYQIYGRENQSEKTAEMIEDWYSSLHQDRLEEKYFYEHDNEQDKTIKNLIKLHADWFEREGIKSTPTFFINSYTLPLNYRIRDVKFLIQSFPEHLLPEIQRVQKKQEAMASI